MAGRVEEYPIMMQKGGKQVSHVKGKLDFEYRECADGMHAEEIFDESGVTVFTASWYPVRVDSHTTVTNREANARRLVACWNALLPFTTEQIEDGIDLVKLVQENAALKTEIERLQNANMLGGWPTREMVEAGYEEASISMIAADISDISAIVKAALAAAPTPPAQDEPIAYAAINFMSGKWGYIWHEKDDVQGWITLQHQSRDDVTYAGPIALYAAPQSDKLRQAAEEVVKISFEKDVIVNLQIFAQAMDNLRTALEAK